MIGWAGSAMALPYYESYTGNQSVAEGQTFDFFFDLRYSNSWFGTPPYTNSSLALQQDAAAGRNAVFTSAYVDMDFYSTDWANEYVSVVLTALGTGGQETVIYSNERFNAYWPGHTTVNLTTGISDLAFINDPYGTLSIKASITSWMNYNDFAITKVAIGAETAPVPEPTTILLFGTGLAGLAAIGRRRKEA